MAGLDEFTPNEVCPEQTLLVSIGPSFAETGPWLDSLGRPARPSARAASAPGNMRKILIAALLLASPLAAKGAPKIDIIVRLPNYDLTQVGGAPSGNEIRGTVASGSETLLDKFSKEFRYNKEFDTNGKPTVRRTAYLGARFFIYAREQGDTIYLLVRIELCQQETPASEIIKSTTSFQGHRASGVPFLIDARAPGNGQTRVEITLIKQGG